MVNAHQEADRYLIKCKENYFKKIRPANSISRSLSDYQTLVDIAKIYFKKDQQRDFSQFFMEGQYLIDLWTAHLILEYGQPDNDLKKESLEIIKSYSKTPLDESLANEEKVFLESYIRNSK